MRTALRVLTAISERRHPDPADADELRRIASVDTDVPLDEVAREVITAAIQSRR